MHDTMWRAMHVPVAGLVGRNCVTVEQGDKIYQHVVGPLKAGDVVELDFSGVVVFATPFFNASLGRLVQELKAEELHTRLKLPNLNENGVAVAKRVIGNAREYLARTPEERKKLDELVLSVPQRS